MRRLERLGWRVKSLGACGDGFDDKLLNEGFHFTPIPLSRRGIQPFSDLHLLVRLAYVFRRERPAVVHTFTIKPAIYATLAAWWSKVPVRVVTITGLGHAFMQERSLLRLAVEKLYRMALKKADIVFFQNPNDRDLFTESGLVARDKVRLVPGSGVDLERFQPTPLPYKNGKPLSFLMIARLLKEKGIQDYVAAATVAKRRFPEAAFTLVGGVDLRNPSGLTRNEFNELNSDGAVEWIGEVEDVRPVISKADVVVLPSYREGVPRSLLEGAAMGRALIATDVVGCREVVEDGATGYLVPVRDAKRLADAFIRLVDDPETVEKFGHAARRIVEERFDEELVINQTLRSYDELLERKLGDGSVARS